MTEEVAAWANAVSAGMADQDRFMAQTLESIGWHADDDRFAYEPPIHELQRQRAEYLDRLHALSQVRPPWGFEQAHEAALELLELYAEVPGYKLMFLLSRSEDEWRATGGNYDASEWMEGFGRRLEALTTAIERVRALTEAAATLQTATAATVTNGPPGSLDASGHAPKPMTSRRAPLPDRVKMYVWQRDGGQCVRCGSNELLEYDHIIPHSRGGSDTERNIQLLCEPCNRRKGSQI